MFPLKDELPLRRFPLVTVALILINVAIFVVGTYTHAKSAPELRQIDVWRLEYAAWPCELVHDCDGAKDISGTVSIPAEEMGVDRPGDIEVTIDHHNAWVRMFTSTFLHAGWMHLIGNMLFLWAFGTNVEDSSSRVKYLIFYLLAGMVASLAQAVTDLHGVIPGVGASGAIAAVIGGYLRLYPRAQILLLFPLGFIPVFFRVPAMIMAGMWGALQFVHTLNGLYGGQDGGVAYAAHLGGFAFGLATVTLIATRKDEYFELYERRKRYI